MVTRDANTFVALARAVALARSEGAIDEKTSSDLAASFVAGLFSGCMEMETYRRVHDALARLLEKAFEGPARGVEAKRPASGPGPGDETPLGVYLEVVGDAWDNVSWDEEACPRLKSFVQSTFDLRHARFGEGAWFEAPLRTDADHFMQSAKNAGLLVVSVEGTPPSRAAEAALRDPTDPTSRSRVVLGWGDRRVALDLTPICDA